MVELEIIKLEYKPDSQIRRGFSPLQTTPSASSDLAVEGTLGRTPGKESDGEDGYLHAWRKCHQEACHFIQLVCCHWFYIGNKKLKENYKTQTQNNNVESSHEEGAPPLELTSYKHPQIQKSLVFNRLQTKSYPSPSVAFIPTLSHCGSH